MHSSLYAKKKGLHGDEANLRAPPTPPQLSVNAPMGISCVLRVQAGLDSNPQGLNFIWDIFPKGTIV